MATKQDRRDTNTTQRGNPLPDWFSTRAQREARRAEGSDEVFGAAYSEGYREGAQSSPDTTSTSSSRQLPQLPLSSLAGGGMPAVTAPLAVELLLIGADELANHHRLPIPSRLLVALLVFGALGMARGEAAKTATVFGWGLVVATFYAANNVGPNALSAVGNFLGGKYAAKTKGATA